MHIRDQSHVDEESLRIVDWAIATCLRNRALHQQDARFDYWIRQPIDVVVDIYECGGL